MCLNIKQSRIGSWSVTGYHMAADPIASYPSSSIPNGGCLWGNCWNSHIPRYLRLRGVGGRAASFTHLHLCKIDTSRQLFLRNDKRPANVNYLGSRR